MAGIATLGVAPLVQSGYTAAVTGDSTEFSQMAGGFAAGLLLPKGIKSGVRGANALAHKVGIRPCFPAGTMLRTPAGWKAVEAFAEGDLIVSKPEGDPEAATTVRRVTRTFERTGKLLELSVNGRLVEATHEYPFWVCGRGWVPAMALATGDELLDSAGSRLLLERVSDFGRWSAVYNLEVEADHTYFVGGEGWGFDIWSHNHNAYAQNGNAVGRGGAFRQAKHDAGIPMKQHPTAVKKVPMTDKWGHQVKNPDGSPVMTREYHYTKPDGSTVVIQDHGFGHTYPGGVGSQGPHFNVRPSQNTRTGHVPGTLEHYPF